MFKCQAGKYHLNTIPSNDGWPSFYIIHNVAKCNYVDEEKTDLQCLGTNSKRIAHSRAERHIASLHCGYSRNVRFCKFCCRGR